MAVAVYDPLKLPRSVWLHRSRTLALPAGSPSALHDAVIEAVAPVRLRSATARLLVPASVFDQTWRLVAGVATRRPCAPSGSWSLATRPLPTSSMSGSFQWPGPAYE